MIERNPMARKLNLVKFVCTIPGDVARDNLNLFPIPPMQLSLVNKPWLIRALHMFSMSSDDVNIVIMRLVFFWYCLSFEEA